MRTLALIATLSILALGCDKSDSPAAEAAAAKTAEPTANAAAGATHTAPAPEAAEEEGSCGGDKESCSGGCNQWDEAAADVAKREAPTDSKWTVIPVEGMTCGGCERRIIANIGELEGILAVEADAELGQVRVATAPDATEPQVIAKAKINELGYTAR